MAELIAVVALFATPAAAVTTAVLPPRGALHAAVAILGGLLIWFWSTALTAGIPCISWDFTRPNDVPRDRAAYCDSSYFGLVQAVPAVVFLLGVVVARRTGSRYPVRASLVLAILSWPTFWI